MENSVRVEIYDQVYHLRGESQEGHAQELARYVDERMRAVARGQPYHFKVERADGKKVEWSVNGVVYFTYVDAEPLAGPGHEHFGFNDWEAPVCFDNLKVTPL